MPLRRPLLESSRWLCLAFVAMGLLRGSADAEEPKKPTHDAAFLPKLPPGAIRRLRTVWHPTGSPVGGVAFSPNGRLLAASAGESVLHLGDPNTFWALRKLVAPQAHEIHCVALSPDGLLLAVGDTDAAVHLWELPEGTYYRRFEGHASTVSALAFHPRGELLASAGADRSVILWDLRGRIRQRLEGHRRDVTCLAFSPDGKTLASGGLDGAIHLWDPATGKRRCTLTTGSGAVRALVIPAEGKSVIAEGAGHVLCRWNLDSGRELGRFRGHRGAIRALALDPKRPRLASSSQDGSVRLWNLESGREERCLDRKEVEASALAFSPDGQTLAIGNRCHVVDLWRLDRKELRPMRDGLRAVVQAVGFDEGDRVLLTRVADEEQRWDTATGKLLGQKRRPPLGPMKRIRAQTADGTLAIEIKCLERDHDKVYSRLMMRSGEKEEEIAWANSPEKEGFAAQCYLWEGGIRCLALSLDGKLLAAGLSDGRVSIWEVATWQRVHDIQGHDEAVTCLAFSRSGRLLLSGSEDATALVWDLAVCPLSPHPRQAVNANDPKDLWAALEGQASGRAFQALQVLHARSGKGLALIEEHVPPVYDNRRLPQLLRDLDSDIFAERQKAFAEVMRLGKAVALDLEKALTEKPSPEVRQSIQRLLKRLTETPEETRAWSRAVLFLERDGSPAAREILEALDRSHSGRRVVAEARNALARMKSPARKP